VYTLMRLVPLRDLLLQQAPTLGISFVMAEVFYKFHSFTLECAAFLATWYGFDFLRQQVAAGLRRARGGATSGT
jgi:hypothetical protein